MKKHTFLVVGGGFGQIPAIITAKANGLYVVVVDMNPHAEGMLLADVALPIDILDVDSVVSVAREYNVIGAMTMQSDLGVSTVGAVIDALGLPGNGRAVAERCSNKILTRQAFAKYGVPQPNFVVVSTEEEAFYAANKVGYPCVIKAPDSSASRGVIKVNLPQDVPNAFMGAMRHTRGQCLLVEEFISGHEVGAQGFSIDGRCIDALVHDDVVKAPPYMVPIGHAFPSSLDRKTLDKVVAAVMTCVDALGIVSGPSNIDIIIDSIGEPKIIEVGARIGATCLPELVFHYTGIDWVDAAIQSAIGAVPVINRKREQPCAAVILEAHRDGVFKGFTVLESVLHQPDLLEWEVTAREGDIVSKLTKGTDRIGKVITSGISSQAAMEKAQLVRAAFDFEIL